MTESTILQWDIDFLSDSDDIERVLYESTDQIGAKQHATSDTGMYEFSLISQSPLTSTMTTNTSTDLSGATVSCSNRLESSADVAMLVLRGKDEYM